MGHKKDQKILELLKDRVIERDNQIERSQVHSSTKEALAELTSLSKSEVDEIYLQVVAEVTQKQKKRRQIIIFSTVVLLLAALIIAPIIVKKLRPALTFVENFDTNEKLWSFSDTYLSGVYYENSNFIVESEVDNESVKYLDMIFNFPKNFTLQVKAKRLGGDHVEGYGFYLGADANNFSYFFVRSDRKKRYGTCAKGEWITSTDWELSDAIKIKDEETNILKVVGIGNDFVFYANDEKVWTKDFYKIENKKLSLAVVGKQKIAYEEVLIIDNDKKDTVYFTNFDQVVPEFVADERSYLKKSEFKDGKYILSVNSPDYCYWAENWLPTEFTKIEEFQIKLYARSLSKERPQANYGFMLMFDTDNFFAFEVKANKFGRIVVCNAKEYTHIGSYIEFRTNNEPVEFQVDVLENEIIFSANGVKIEKIPRNYLYTSDFNKLALRACDIQSVSFDRLEITEIK